MNAAQIAYKKAISKTRKAIAEGGGKSQPAWLKEFANRLPEEGELDCVPEIKDKVALRKKALGDGESEKTYEQLAFWIYTNVVSQNAFEVGLIIHNLRRRPFAPHIIDLPFFVVHQHTRLSSF